MKQLCKQSLIGGREDKANLDEPHVDTVPGWEERTEVGAVPNLLSRDDIVPRTVRDTMNACK